MKRGKKKRTRENKNTNPEAFSVRPFANLKKVAPLEIEEQPAPQEKETPELSQTPDTAPEISDDHLYASEMNDVRPLNDRQLYAEKIATPQPLIIDTDNDEDELVMRQLDDLVHGQMEFDFADTSEYIEANVAGLDKRLVRKLRRGEYSIQAHLDLHGMRRSEARDQVARFIRKTYEENKRCILIVHGRGLGSRDNIPVLKNKLSAWLTRGSIGKKVLAFTSALPYDGGTGAIYVLLRS